VCRTADRTAETAAARWDQNDAPARSGGGDQCGHGGWRSDAGLVLRRGLACRSRHECRHDGRREIRRGTGNRGAHPVRGRKDGKGGCAREERYCTPCGASEESDSGLRLYCATGNKGKLREFHFAAEPGGVDIELVPRFGTVPSPVEDGATF